MMSLRTTRLTLTLVTFFSWLSGCSDLPVRRVSDQPLATVPYVDLAQYSGLWFNLANFPAPFQSGCSNTTATYRPQADGRISVLNRCLRNDHWEEILGLARAIDPSGSRLKVRFFRFLPEGDYWIIDLKEDYSRAIVGEPSGRYLWVLARTPNLSISDRDEILERIRQLGYSTNGLEWTEHNPAQPD